MVKKPYINLGLLSKKKKPTKHKKMKLPKHLQKLLRSKRTKMMMKQFAKEDILKLSKGRITVVPIGNINAYEIRIGRIPLSRTIGKLNAERIANNFRKTIDRKVR